MAPCTDFALKTNPSGAQIGTLMWQRVEREKGFSLRRRHHAGFCRPTILSLPLIPSGAETLVFWVPQRLASPVAPKNVQLMTRRDDLKLLHGATAKARENFVKQDRVQATNTIGITRKGLDFYAG